VNRDGGNVTAENGEGLDQGAAPATAWFVWDKNPPQEVVTSYKINCGTPETTVSFPTTALTDLTTQWETPASGVVTADGSYRCFLTATNMAGESDPSGGVDFLVIGGIVTLPPTTPPGAPTGFGVVHR